MTEVKVGSIFVESWGYDQTNIDAYQVVGGPTKGGRVWITPIAVEVVEGTKRVRPVPGKLLGKWSKPKLKLVHNPESPFVTMTSYSIARLWDGERTYHDTIAAGEPGH